MARGRAWLLAVALAAGCADGATPSPVPPAPGPPPERAGAPPADPDGEPDPLGAPVPDPDFPEKSPPQPGDWLHSFPEPGQTVEEYRLDCRNRKADDRDRIVIRPLGGIAERHGDLLGKVREYLSIYYHCETVVLDPDSLPDHALDRGRRQYDADRILLSLRNSLPGDALAYVGFCEEDLFSGNLNFVFGVGSLQRRVGVYSLHRYGTEEKALLRRALKVAAHEVGHILGMPHCVRWECCMNGSNSVREMDGRPMFLCPDCREKARWNVRFDPAERYDALAAFLEREGFPGDAAFARRQAGKARAAPRSPGTR